MSRILRPYQQSFCAQIRTLWDRGVDRVIGVLPTGGGKTECAAELSAGFENVLSICHTRVLCDQLEARLSRAMTWQGLRVRQQSCSPDTVWPWGVPDLIVVDEVHVGDSPDWQHVFEMVPEGTKVLGLTATPWRFSHGLRRDTSNTEDSAVKVGGRKNAKHGKGLGDLFGAMIVGVTPRELVRNGYLVPLRVMNIIEAQDAAAELAGLKGPGWDEKKGKHLHRIKAGSDTRLDPVDAWLKFGENRKAMVFGHMIASAERAAARFQACGVAADVVHGKIPADECKRRLDRFKAGELKVLVNVMQLTAGVDVPDVECIILDRGANNLNTYIQICGRGARLAPGKTDCLILDLTGCSSKHGDPQKDQDYWVVTSEGRPVSELACEVCGTKLSPMFPQRCMRCDPFRPKLGDPKELLDTGMRVYCALKDRREQDDWSALDSDAQDRAVIQALDDCQLEQPTDLERETVLSERAAAVERIRVRAADLEALRMAEERERLRLEREAVAAQERLARAEERAKMADRVRAENDRLHAEHKTKEAERAARFAEWYRSKQEAQQWPPAEHEQAIRALTAKFQLWIQRNWSLSSAVRDVRQTLPRYSGKYSRENYTVPECLLPLLTQLNASWCQQSADFGGGPRESLAQYEFRRMTTDPRTSRYGDAWCRKKVRELFGHDCFNIRLPGFVDDAGPAVPPLTKRLELEMQQDALDDVPF